MNHRKEQLIQELHYYIRRKKELGDELEDYEIFELGDHRYRTLRELSYECTKTIWDLQQRLATI